jgi:hypothetical protein
MRGVSIEERMAVRLRLVDEHIRFENQHNLECIMGTFGVAARYDDDPWNVHYTGRKEVETFYDGLLQALPGLQIDVRHRHAGVAATWRGLPATGRQIEFPLCGIFTFDEEDRLAGENIYYDRAAVLKQLGVLHEPDSIMGRISNVLMPPLTMAQVVG